MPVKIMLADDHVMFREGLKKLLESVENFMIVGEAEDGDDTLRKISEIEPDIILLDINMPKMDGLEVLMHMRKKGIKTNVILITYHDEMDYLIRGINFGANGYLLKKSSFLELKDAIMTVMDGKKYIQSSLIPELSSKMAQQDRDKEKIDNLTRRELEVLRLMAIGMYNKEIAKNLDISERTVKNHVSNIFKKIIVNDRTQAAVFAIKNNLINI